VLKLNIHRTKETIKNVSQNKEQKRTFKNIVTSIVLIDLYCGNFIRH